MPPPCFSSPAHGTAGRVRLAALVASALVLPALAAPRREGLETEVRATWTRTPIREWADRMSDMAGVPVIVDRRLDPSVRVTLTSDGATLRSLLDRVAEAAGGAVEPLASTVRLVPGGVVGRASAAEAARAATVRRLPVELRRRVERRASWAWPAGATPRGLVAAAASEASVPVAGLDRIPHDHVPAASLPPLSLAERLDLVLAGFDLRVAWTPQGGSVVPITEGVGASPPTAPPRGRDRPAVAGPQPATGGVDTYSLRLEAPLDVAVPAVAARLGLTSSIDAASLTARGIAPGEIVRVEVRDADRVGLLDAIVRPLGLSWSIDDGTLQVFAAPVTSGSTP